MSKNVTTLTEKHHSWMNQNSLIIPFPCHRSGLENCLCNGNAKTTCVHCLKILHFLVACIECDELFAAFKIRFATLSVIPVEDYDLLDHNAV
jgi:hypothetical protein